MCVTTMVADLGKQVGKVCRSRAFDTCMTERAEQRPGEERLPCREDSAETNVGEKELEWGEQGEQ